MVELSIARKKSISFFSADTDSRNLLLPAPSALNPVVNRGSWLNLSLSFFRLQFCAELMTGIKSKINSHFIDKD
jgi:hypothetical protein